MAEARAASKDIGDGQPDLCLTVLSSWDHLHFEMILGPEGYLDGVEDGSVAHHLA